MLKCLYIEKKCLHSYWKFYFILYLQTTIQKYNLTAIKIVYKSKLNNYFFFISIKKTGSIIISIEILTITKKTAAIVNQ